MYIYHKKIIYFQCSNYSYAYTITNYNFNICRLNYNCVMNQYSMIANVIYTSNFSKYHTHYNLYILNAMGPSC